MMTRELLQMALDALWDCMNSHGDADWSKVDATMSKIRVHLAKPAPDPVAWVSARHDEPYDGLQWFKDDYSSTPLYRKDQL